MPTFPAVRACGSTSEGERARDSAPSLANARAAGGREVRLRGARARASHKSSSPKIIHRGGCNPSRNARAKCMRATSFLQHGPAPPQCALTQSTSSTVVVEQRKVSACFSKTIGVSSEAHSWSDSLERAAAPSSLITNSRFGVLSYTRAHVFRLPLNTRAAYHLWFNVVGIYITTSLVVSGGSFVVSGGAAVPTTAIKTAISTLRCPSGAITPSSDTTFEKDGFEGTCAARERGAGAAPRRARTTHAPPRRE